MKGDMQYLSFRIGFFSLSAVLFILHSFPRDIITCSIVTKTAQCLCPAPFDLFHSLAGRCRGSSQALAARTDTLRSMGGRHPCSRLYGYLSGPYSVEGPMGHVVVLFLAC